MEDSGQERNSSRKERLTGKTWQKKNCIGKRKIYWIKQDWLGRARFTGKSKIDRIKSDWKETLAGQSKINMIKKDWQDKAGLIG